jgi:asparagine synthase (glutamine-hydrolysing)
MSVILNNPQYWRWLIVCGISFYCSSRAHYENELNLSLTRIRHRGPDSHGVIIKDCGQFSIGIGHNRLSIIDLSQAASQPMVSSLRTVIAFNGEVYNFKELKLNLVKKGAVFNSSSDTEVVLQMYDIYGVESFGMFRGIFSFVLLDNVNNKLFVVRDFIGVKPIYIYQDDNELYGSSEIKGLLAFKNVKKDIDKTDVFEFFNQGNLYEPNTGYKYIKKIMPCHYLELNLLSSESSIIKYQKNIDISSYLNLDKIIQAANDEQHFADVPVGLFFSGGADSSILACYSDVKKLLFAKYDSDTISDIDYKFSHKIAEYLGKEIITENLESGKKTKELIMKEIDFIAQNSEELIADYTFLSTYQLSSKAKKNGFTVMLSGIGGDEIFAGYPRYLILKYHQLIKFLQPILKILLRFNLFPKRLDKKFERLISYCKEKNWMFSYARLLGYFSDSELKTLFTDEQLLKNKLNDRFTKLQLDLKLSNRDKVRSALSLDSLGYLSRNLMVADKASMLASIELRVPMLDERVYFFGRNLSAKLLIKKGKLKYMLKEVLSKLLPTHLVKRPKAGFNPPLDGVIKQLGRDFIIKEIANLDSFLNLKSANQIVDDHFNKGRNNTYKIWQLLYFSRWVKLKEK